MCGNVQGCSERLKDAQGHSGMLREAMECSGLVRDAQGFSSMLRNVPGRSGIFQECSGMHWEFSEIFRDALGSLLSEAGALAGAAVPGEAVAPSQGLLLCSPPFPTLQSRSPAVPQIRYKEEFEKNKGKGFSVVADTPELQRIKKTQDQISNVSGSSSPL